MKGEKPEIIISDIGMPDADGYAFMEEVRNLPEAEGGKTPAIAVTGFARPEDRICAMTAGYQMHFCKPIDAHQLISAVSKLIRNHENV